MLSFQISYLTLMLFLINNILSEELYYTFFDKSNSPIKYYLGYNSTLSMDSSGNIYLGTDSGLYKFDYNEWKEFNKNNSGLPGNKIYKILIDKDNKKWISTDRGIAIFDGDNWIDIKALSGCLDSSEIDPQDYDEENRIWFLGKNSILIHQENKCINFDTLIIKTLGVLPENILVSKSNNIYFNTECDVIEYDGKNWKIIFSFFPRDTNFNIEGIHRISPTINKIVEGPDTSIWILTDNGLYRMHNGNIASFIFEYEYPRISKWMNDLIFDSKGNKWLLSGDDLIKCENNEFFNYFHTKRIKYGNYIFKKLLIDKYDNIWLICGNLNAILIFNEEMLKGFDKIKDKLK